MYVHETELAGSLSGCNIM